jgi:hydrogenase maturation protease
MNEWEWQLLEDKNVIDHVEIDGISVKTGDRVRLRPRECGDIMDIALRGQLATIEALEQDYEGKMHVCVVLDEDPGRDLGLLRQPGHRFFFDATEVEPLPDGAGQKKTAKQKPAILIAGVGNIFMGDDAFGVEVAKRLSAKTFPDSVRIVDFGIRGLDLVYALQDGYDATILIDACQRGQPPGTVYVIEPDLTAVDDVAANAVVDSHGMDPMNVIRMAKAMNAPLKRLLVVGCEPETLGGEQGQMGLSSTVEAALDEAVRVVQDVVERILNGTWKDAKDRGPEN